MNSTQRPSIQAVLFDFGQVLSLSPDPVAWQHMLQISGLDNQAFAQGYWAFRHAYDRGELTGIDYWHKVAANAGISFSANQVAELIEADIQLWSRINAPMLDWAQRLQTAGMRTGILSNIGDEMTDGLLRKLDWLAAFDHHVWSYRLLLAKPEAEIYAAAARGLNTPPEHILFIDDKAENIAAARDFGMQAIQYSDHPAFLREMENRNLGYLLNLSASSVS
ncbi:HAD family hydrolase [Edaphobacter flagellatus]|uniref:HAD family hydrolase n=1 Tax=Edaphobacter flagellatus TaxID=1933044 RepID=UPI0021B3A169|nr:HAD family phosphatase [Edaphobacter flagellatus]